jgi:ABC-type Zn uptake system ZnuABC Zn-binding protein ZnuA
MGLGRRHFVLFAAAALAGPGVLVARAQDATPAPDAPTSSLGWSDPLDATDRLNVATTVAPISSIVRNVGGDRIQVRGVVPDGTNSHTFEPAPSDAKIVANADLIFVNGLNLELPTLELAEANLKDGAEIIKLGDQTISPEEWVFDFSFPEEDGDPNPHLWTHMLFAKRYAEIVAENLSRRDPEGADYYAENLARYSAVLDRLDAAALEAVQTIPEQNRRLLTYHDSWAYFAPHAGLTVIGAAQPSDFSEPSPKEVAGLIEQIRAEQVPAIFGSEVFPSDVLEQIAAESGAAYIDQLRDDDPPGEPGAPEHTYVGMMLKNFELMIPALGGNIDAFAGIEPWDTWVPSAS